MILCIPITKPLDIWKKKTTCTSNFLVIVGLLKPGISVISGTWRDVKIQDVWWMHCSLSAAAAEINSTYSAQLFVWIVTISLNMLSRVYTLIITMSNEDSTFRKIREFMWTIACLINLFLIVGSCHITSREVIWKYFILY